MRMARRSRLSDTVSNDRMDCLERTNLRVQSALSVMSGRLLASKVVRRLRTDAGDYALNQPRTVVVGYM